MKEFTNLKRIAFVGDHLPRKCGIATFTSDLLAAVANAAPETDCFCVAVNDLRTGYNYPGAVQFEIEEQDRSSYLRAARYLNRTEVDVVCLQHEFGIYGGTAGSHILALLRELRVPVVTTLHTVLRHPNLDQRRVMQEIISLSSRLVVMTGRGQQMLQEVYQAPPEKITQIAHGIPDVPSFDPDGFKERFGMKEKLLLLTFGLLSPNKGIEYVLRALPEILKQFPKLHYVVLGATHPNELRENGEAYRTRLEQIVTALEIEDNVFFYNDFVDMQSLNEFIGAADLYITPYLNEAQITSGTLAYTFGSGKAVISTPYWHAAELLAHGRGVLVPFADAEAVAREVIGLLSDQPRRKAMCENAYNIGREMVWSHVGQLYMQTFLRAKRQGNTNTQTKQIGQLSGRQPRALPSLKLTHLTRMTDSTGIFQHATFNVPNFSEGYCTDDNARALILAVLLGELEESPELAGFLTSTSAAFLHYAFDHQSSRFHNHLSFDRQWLDVQGSEDCQGRALWALGMGVGRLSRKGEQTMAARLFSRALPALTSFTSPRAWSFALLGIHEYLRRPAGDPAVEDARSTLTARLLELLDQNAKPDWHWFEQELSYDNAKLAHALILSGQSMGHNEACEQGLRALRWLNEIQISEQGHFRPIGSNGFFQRGGFRAVFDQQPIEAHAMVSACLEAYRTTSDYWWFQQAQRAFDWFLGGNDLGLELYSPESGACGDGLHIDRVNANQGAESTLAFLLSLAELRLAQNEMNLLRESIHQRVGS